eukprot:2104890-Heterocapsa_arctica.AAC.1
MPEARGQRPEATDHTPSGACTVRACSGSGARTARACRASACSASGAGLPARSEPEPTGPARSEPAEPVGHA